MTTNKDLEHAIQRAAKSAHYQTECLSSMGAMGASDTIVSTFRLLPPFELVALLMVTKADKDLEHTLQRAMASAHYHAECLSSLATLGATDTAISALRSLSPDELVAIVTFVSECARKMGEQVRGEQ